MMLDELSLEVDPPCMSTYHFHHLHALLKGLKCENNRGFAGSVLGSYNHITVGQARVYFFTNNLESRNH